ncbi:MAG: pirin family protein [Pseudomonadota bacterium]
MIRIHDRDARGASKTGWLDSRHTFSFGGFMDPNRMGVSALRVINEDHVIPGAGFPTHGHRDMEILTYVVSGALAHKDSLGNGSTIRPGDVQLMTAGTGITHSEMNASGEDPVHFFQIWIQPNVRGASPGYQQSALPDEAGRGGFTPIVTPEGGEGQVKIHQDTVVSLARPAEGESLEAAVGAGRYGFLQVVKGQVSLLGETLRNGDGLEFAGGKRLDLVAHTDAELLLFDLP